MVDVVTPSLEDKQKYSPQEVVFDEMTPPSFLLTD
jgi:hypothetical protein